ncbi:MAG: (Na+)-NQR maturation NqrM [Brachymonas sp.]|nr:(Na+)-NQR maturation NqrM [Brachymonas sp.]
MSSNLSVNSMIFLLAALAFLLAFTALALGLLLRGKPLQGSCGGTARLMGDEKCSVCGGNPAACPNSEQAPQNPNEKPDARA